MGKSEKSDKKLTLRYTFPVSQEAFDYWDAENKKDWHLGERTKSIKIEFVDGSFAHLNYAKFFCDEAQKLVIIDTEHCGKFPIHLSSIAAVLLSEEWRESPVMVSTATNNWWEDFDDRQSHPEDHLVLDEVMKK